MPEKKVTVPLQDGSTAEGVDVPVVETTERWSEVKLGDGTIFRIKPLVAAVTRLEGKYDPEGNPMYALKAGHSMVLDSVPQDLRKSKVQ